MSHLPDPSLIKKDKFPWRALEMAFFIVAILFFSKNYIRAVPAMEGRPHPKSPTCFANPQAYNARLAAIAHSKVGFAPPLAPTGYKVAVIRVDFSDQPAA